MGFWTSARSRLGSVDRRTILIAAILLLAVLLRFWDLGAESLWADELSTLNQVSQGPIHAISDTVVRGTPPVYYVIQTALYEILPKGEASLRLLSALVDIISVLLVFLLGRRLVKEEAALLGMALYAVSIRAIWFAQEARAYSLATMLVLLAALTLLQMVEKPTWKRTAIHALVGIALLYTHVYAAFALAGIELAVIVMPRLRHRALRQWLVAACSMAVAYIPWLLIVVNQASGRAAMAEQGTWTISPPQGILTPLMDAITAFAPGPMQSIPYQGPPGWQAPVFGALVIFGVLGVGAFRPQDTQTEAAGTDIFELTAGERRSILIGWLGAVLIGGLVVSLYVLPIFTFRMATVAMPALYLAAANGMLMLWRPASIVLLVATVALSARGLHPYYADNGGGNRYEKEQWREAIEYVIDTEGEFDAIFVVPGWHGSQMIAYAEAMDRPLNADLTFVLREAEGEALRAQYEPALVTAEKVLVISGHARLDDDGLTALERALLDTGDWSETSLDTLRGVRLRTFDRL